MPRAGIPAGQTRATALALLEHNATITAKELADKEGIGPTSASTTLHKMAREGVLTQISGGKGRSGPGVFELARPGSTVAAPAASPPVRAIREKRGSDTRIAEALRLLYPKGLTNVDPLQLLQWVDMTKDMLQ